MNLLITTIDQVLLNPLKNDVFSVAFFAMALLLATVWRNFLIVFVHKTREMVLSHDWRTFEAENANSGPRLRLSLVVVNLSSISIFLYQLNRYLDAPLVPYWQLLLALTSLHILRILVTKFIEVLFKFRGLYEMWVESYTWIHYVLGVLFFPLAILMTYSPDLTFTFCANLALGLFILGELLLFYRLFFIFYNGIASLFYLFLYLCTLEIIPLLTVFRFLS